MRSLMVLSAAALVLTGCSAAEASRCRVTGPGTPAEHTALVAACERALPVLEQVWPQWTGPAEIVRSGEPLGEGTAAYVTGHARPGEPAQDDRLVVAPGLTATLSSAGLDVVLRHELTHLAMRATGTAPIPLWVAEGLAEHVGYASVADERRDRRAELARLAARVTDGSWPGSVPSEHLLADPADRADAYTAAWLGVEVLVAEHGLAALTAAVQAPEPGTRSDGVDLWDRLGESPSGLAGRWREELVRRTTGVD